MSKILLRNAIIYLMIEPDSHCMIHAYNDFAFAR